MPKAAAAFADADDDLDNLEEEEQEEEQEEEEDGEESEEQEEEEDGEGEEEEEAEEPTAEELARIASKGRTTVPLARLNQVSERARLAAERANAAETELNALKASQKLAADAEAAKKAAEPPFDFKKAQKEYTDAVLEGETDKALEIFESMMTARETQTVNKAQAAALKIVEEAQALRNAEDEQNAVTKAADQVLRAYPDLDPSSKTHNKTLLKTFALFRDGHRANGMSQSQAMRQARIDLADIAPPKAGTSNKTGRAAPKAADTAHEDAAYAKLREKLKAARKVPPATHRSGAGVAAQRSDLSDDEIEGMSTAQANRLLREMG